MRAGSHILRRGGASWLQDRSCSSSSRCSLTFALSYTNFAFHTRSLKAFDTPPHQTSEKLLPKSHTVSLAILAVHIQTFLSHLNRTSILRSTNGHHVPRHPMGRRRQRETSRHPSRQSRSLCARSRWEQCRPHHCALPQYPQ